MMNYDFPEHPLMESPYMEIPECTKCEGWGIVLGSDTEAEWGLPCDCGVEMQIPIGVEETRRFERAHAEFRAKAGKVKVLAGVA